MQPLGDHLFLDGTIVQGTAVPDDGELRLRPGEVPGDAEPGLLVPPLVNAHTHLGDAALAPLELDGTIEEVFAPPDGLKHRHLRKLSEDDAVEGMRQAIGTMHDRGVGRFHDFREGGLDGVALLERALEDAEVEGQILGRPEGLAYDAEEIDTLLDRCAGLGLSAAQDFPPDEVEAIARHVADRGGTLALHASEAEREPIGPVLELGPDLLVHLCKATDEDLDAIADADADVRVACCPRSNERFGLEPPIPELLHRRIPVHLGTDNAMFQSPSVLDEALFTLDRFPGLAPEAVLAMATTDPLDGGPAGFPGERVPAAVRVAFEGEDPRAALRRGEARVAGTWP